MPAVDDFQANPPAFMRNNHLVYRGAGPENAGGNVHPFALVPAERGARVRAGSVFLGLGNAKDDAGAFDMRSVAAGHPDSRSPDAGQFNAFWSGFQAGMAIHCDLPANGEAIMLTPELTGCTVVWVARPDGTARFSHYNLMAGAQTLDDNAMAAQAEADYAGDAGFGCMSKGYYRGMRKDGANDVRATVVGWRNGGGWTFWAQYVENKAGVYQIRGVEQLQAGRQL